MTTRNDETEKLRREIGRRESTRGPLRRDLRERCKRYAAARFSAGASHEVIATELGLSVMTVQRWMRTGSKTTASAMVPVRVVATRARTETGSRHIVTTARGLRVEGLDLDALCMLIARFG